MTDTTQTGADCAPPPALQLADLLGILLLVCILLTLSYFRSRHRMFWSDEIMGRFVLTQPSASSLLHVWRAGLDSSGIWFYVLARPWIGLFSGSEVSLRMFSAVGIAASAATVWIVARRFYAVLPVAAAVSFVYASTNALRWQLANGRTYGVFMFACAAVLFLLLRPSGNGRAGSHSESGTRPRLLPVTFAAYMLLAGSHILGVLYCTAFLAMQIGLDLRARRLRPWLYLTAAVPSALVAAFSWANIQSTAALGRPRFWTLRPPVSDLLSAGTIFDHRVRALLGIILLLAFFSLQLRRRRMPVYFVLLGFAAIDLVIFTISRIGTSIYVDRYLMPLGFAAIFLFCELMTQISESPGAHRWLRAALPAAVLAAAAACFFVPRIQRFWLPVPDYTDALLRSLPPGIPVIDTDVSTFMEIEFYHHGWMHRPLLFPADRQTALDPSNTAGVSGYNELDLFKELGIYAQDILPTADILAHPSQFVVLSAPPALWLKHYILANPAFTVSRLGSFRSSDATLDIWLVDTRLPPR